jgi:pimeloyl-ACP methyl ester carboxylesterase
MNEYQLNTKPEDEATGSGVCGALKTGLFLIGAAVAAAAVTNAVIASNTPNIGTRLGGVLNRVPLRYGDAAYMVAGSGSPVLLLHAPRPGNSSAEWEENFDALSHHHTVYALDFLGWGLSDKPRHVLRPNDYIEQIRDFAENVIGEKCAVIASGEAAVYALHAAQHAPELFSSLALICPPDHIESDIDEEPVANPEERNLLYKLFTLPVIGTALSNWLTAHPQLESNAQGNLFFDPAQVTPGRLSRMHITAHQPAAQQAHAAYFSGLLGTNWRAAWSEVELPTLLLWGRNAPEFINTPEWLALKPDARLEVFDNAQLLPHVEHALDFNQRILKWLA